MKDFAYFQPTELLFGAGRIKEVGEVVARFGKRCLLVTAPEIDVFKDLFAKVKKSLEEAGVAVAHFDGVVPNPTTECNSKGAKMAVEFNADVVLGLGKWNHLSRFHSIHLQGCYSSVRHNGPHL